MPLLFEDCQSSFGTATTWVTGIWDPALPPGWVQVLGVSCLTDLSIIRDRNRLRLPWCRIFRYKENFGLPGKGRTPPMTLALEWNRSGTQPSPLNAGSVPMGIHTSTQPHTITYVRDEWYIKAWGHRKSKAWTGD